MKLMLVLFLFSTQSAFAIDTGDGSDGTCDVTGAATTQITSARKSYQCTTLNINGNLSAFNGVSAGGGGAVVLIKVQGSVTVAAGVTIDLSGENGIDGTTTAVNGGRSGAGGGAGGNSQLGLAGLNGAGSGAGLGGSHVAVANAISFGGGGGGGSFKTQSVTSATDGDDGNGSVGGTLGANGSTFGNEATFETSFTGGSGGGAGGSGEDGATIMAGSSGGGGGGALHIVAGGNILVDGSIISGGGNGGGIGTTAASGAGGGASGGAIWLQAAGTLTVSASGTITALGGTGGTNTSGFSGLGGNGGDGRIRLDDGDGAITNLGTVSPAPFSTSFSPTPITSGTSSLSRQYSSSISCARVSEKFNFNYLINLMLGLILVSGTHLAVSRREKV